MDSKNQIQKRELKFRAYSNVSEKMMDWNFIKAVGNLTKLICLDHISLMQFTGREDAEINGKEVYEGDIIENCDTKDLQIVYWNDNQSAWFCKYVFDKLRIVSLTDSLGNLNKVIGNIYENPDLLKV